MRSKPPTRAHERDQEAVFLITFVRGADGRITGYESEGGRLYRRR